LYAKFNTDFEPDCQDISHLNIFYDFSYLRGRGVFFLPYKPVALHPVASAPIQALTCFCLSPLLAEKDCHPVLGTVWPLTACQDDRPGASNGQRAIAAEKGKTRRGFLLE
jgi:hypothetical protein